MAAGNGRAPAMQEAMFSAFDEIVLDVQRLERETYSETTLCQKLNKRLEELDAEEKKVQEQTLSFCAKSQEKFKKEVDAQAALDCITKTLQLENASHVRLRFQLQVANDKAVVQNRRLTATEEKYRELWDSYESVYKSFPLVKELQGMTDLVEHDKIKLMQANFDLREAHNQIVQMSKISDLAKKVKIVNLAEVFCAHAASKRKEIDILLQMCELEAGVSRDMDRKKQLLARYASKPTNEPAQATVPISQAAAMPVASCTGQALGNITSLLNLQILPQMSTLSASNSRQASLDLVRARYAKRSWPSNESSISSEKSPPKNSLLLETAVSIPQQKMDFSPQNSQTLADVLTKPTEVESSSQKTTKEPMQMESSSQNQTQTLEVPMQISDLHSQNLESTDQNLRCSEEDVEPHHSQGVPQGFEQKGIPTQLNMGSDTSQDQFSQNSQKANQMANHQSAMTIPSQAMSLIGIVKPSVTELPASQTMQDLSGKSTFDAVNSVSSTTIHRGTRTAREERPIIPGNYMVEREDGRVTVMPPQQSEWPPTSFASSTPMEEEGATPGGTAFRSGVQDGNAAICTSGNNPEQSGERDNDMDAMPSASQDEFESSQGEYNCSQKSVSNCMSRVEYLKKLKQSPEFRYAPRLMFNRQELGSEQEGISSPYFQPLVSEASAYRNQGGPSLPGNDYEHLKELQAQLSQNEPLQCSQQNEQFPSLSIQNQQHPSHQAQIQKPESKQFSNLVMQARELQVQQFSSELPQGQYHSQNIQHKTVQVHQPQVQQLSAQAELPRELHSQNDIQQAQIWRGSQEDHSPAKAIGQYGSATAQTTRQFESYGNSSAQPTNQPGTMDNGTEKTAYQFGSQGNNIAQNATQAANQSDGIAANSGQFIHQTITSPLSDSPFMSKQPLSQGSDSFYTPRQSEGDGTRIEMGGGDFGGSPLSSFLSPGETNGAGHQGPAAPDIHDSSSNESFQYKSPSCSPPPAEPAGFSFMGSNPKQMTSMFGAPSTAEKGGGDAQQKPSNEAFNFDFTGNSSKSSVFKLF